MADQITPPTEGAEGAEGTEPTQDMNAPVDDNQYDDVLYAALDEIYKSIDENGGFVETPAGGDDEGGEGDEGGEPKPKQKSVDEMDLAELKAAFLKQGKTLKEVVGLSLQEREEKAALDAWNSFLDEATEVEKAVAKSFGGTEVESKEDVERLIKQAKAVAAATTQIITDKTVASDIARKKALQAQYGIMTPEPTEDSDTADQDARDMKNRDYRKLISRRFRQSRS